MKLRRFTLLDRVIVAVDDAIHTLTGAIPAAARKNPANEVHETLLKPQDKKHIAGLMRVNHTGEVCAQALYQSQAITAKSDILKTSMEMAAAEENDHLHWCHDRIQDLGSHTSYLNPLWYIGSFCIGTVAGVVSDRFSLGFLAETERQVVRHLENHLQKIPEEDLKTRTIILQMRDDELKHATFAVNAGAYELPPPVKKLMQFTSRIMTQVAYYL